MDYRYYKVPTKPLTLEQVKAVLNAFTGIHKTRNKALFIVLLATGYRISEILSLHIQDVLKFGQIVDTITVVRSRMKGKKFSRTIKLTEEARFCIGTYLLECQRTEGRLFDFTRYQADKIFRETFKRAQVEYRGTHFARKTFAVNIYEALNYDIFTLSKLMGHSSVVITQKYLYTHQKRIDDAVLSANYLK